MSNGDKEPIKTVKIKQKKRRFPQPVIEYWEDALRNLLDWYAEESFNLMNPEYSEIMKFVNGVDVAPDPEGIYRLIALKQFYRDHPEVEEPQALTSQCRYHHFLGMVYDRMWMVFEDAADDGQYRGEHLLFRLLEARLSLEQVLALTTGDTKQNGDSVHIVLDTDPERTLTLPDRLFFHHLDLDADDEPLVQMSKDKARNLFHDAAEAANVEGLTIEQFHQLCRLQWDEDLPDWTVNLIATLDDMNIVDAPVTRLDNQPVLDALADCDSVQDFRLWKYKAMQHRVLTRSELYRIGDMAEDVLEQVSDEEIAEAGDNLRAAVAEGIL